MLFSTTLFSQQKIEGNFKYRNYSVESGLPSSETYAIEQDNEGNIWIATDRGVVKYDGIKFKKYTEKDGLVNNVVYQLYKDPFGKIWFICMKSGLCYYEKGRIKKYKYNHTISKLTKNLIHSDRNILVKKDHTVIIGFREYGLIEINEKGIYKHTKQKSPTINVNLIDNNIIWSNSGENIPVFNWKTNVYFKKKSESKLIFKNEILSPNSKILCLKYLNQNFVLFNNSVYNLTSHKKILDLKKTRIISFQIIKNEFWLGTLKEGVKIYHLKNGKLHFNRDILNKYSVTSVKIDNHNGYWFSTLETGVFYLPFKSIQNYDAKNGLISSEIKDLIGINNKLFIGFSGSNYQTIQGNFTEKYFLNAHSYTSFGKINNNLIISNSKGTYYDHKMVDYAWEKDFYSTNNYVLAAKEQVLKIFPNGTIKILRPFGLKNRIFFEAIMEDNHGEIWLGNIDGLYKLKNIHAIPFNHYKFPYRITDLAYNQQWGKLVATREGGLFSLKNDAFTKIKNLLSDDITYLFFQNPYILWVGTNKGVNILTKNKKGIIVIDCITKNHGLLSNEITSITSNNIFAWIGTKKGLSKLNLKEFKIYKGDYKIRLNSITLNQNQKIDLGKKLKIPYNIDRVKINFGVINFVTKGNYKYRFHSSSNWYFSKSPEITLYNPEDGNYDLEVSYLNENNNWSSIQKIVHFEVTPPYWRTIYFKVLLVFIAIFLILLFIKYKKKQFETKQKLLILEQKALFAQMNPHFIFNTLNSIQSFLIYNENDKAEYFLSKFSKLLRETLHISRNSSVLLSKEIDILKKYLELEQMRFSNKFQWEITFKSLDVKLDFRIPNMLIQPYIENSIKHGFTEKRSDFKIDIIFTLIDEFTLKCEVIDNGIGREASQLNKKNDVKLKGHVSYGEKITKERLMSYNKKGKFNYGSNYFLPENNGGTKVEILIPILNLTKE